jgi:hypothetical protein
VNIYLQDADSRILCNPLSQFAALNRPISSQRSPTFARARPRRADRSQAAGRSGFDGTGHSTFSSRTAVRNMLSRKLSVLSQADDRRRLCCKGARGGATNPAERGAAAPAVNPRAAAGDDLLPGDQAQPRSLRLQRLRVIATSTSRVKPPGGRPRSGSAAAPPVRRKFAFQPSARSGRHARSRWSLPGSISPLTATPSVRVSRRKPISNGRKVAETSLISRCAADSTRTAYRKLDRDNPKTTHGRAGSNPVALPSPLSSTPYRGSS